MRIHTKNLIMCSLAAMFLLSMIYLNGPVHAEYSNVTRLSGNDRYETAIAISKQGWKSSDYAVLARGDDFPDALCAAPLAMKYNAPILLTDPKKLNDEVLAELLRLNVKHVIITGGTGAVSSSIENTLKSKSMDVERLGGQDRYETSVEIARKVGSSSKAVLATGDNFPDSLSISPVAAKLGMPILLTSKSYLPSSVWQFMEDSQVRTTYIIGGKGVISDSILELVHGPKRISGNNRYETNVAVLKEFSGDFSFKNIFLSVADGPSGDEFADALSGSVLAARSSSPVVLVYKTLPPVTDYFIRPQITSDTVLTILGGEAVVPSSIASSLKGEGKAPVRVEISNPPATIRAWQNRTLDITTYPNDAALKVYSSSTKTAVASVSGKTLTVTGVSPGMSVITVVAEKDGYPAGEATFLVSSPVYNSRRDTYFDTIQGAINYAYSGDTIRIAAGTYYEHLNINANSLKLIGEDRDTTIIDATQNGVVTKAGIRIKDYWGTEIRNLTVRNAGINVTGEANKEPYGILLWNSDQNIIQNVSLKSNGSYEMYLSEGSDSNTIAGCIIDGTGAGRDGYRSLDGIFSCGGEPKNGNPGQVNTGNRFFSNVICNVVTGISLTATNNSWIMNNDIKALDSSYWKGYTSAGIVLSNSSMNLLEGNTIDSSQYGVRLSVLSSLSPYAYAGPPTSNILRDNIVSAIEVGIKVVGTENIVQGNTVSKHSDSGIWLADSAWSTDVSGNTLDNNTVDLLVDNGMNEAHKNKITGGSWGVKNTSNTQFDASQNWWGSGSGPGGRISGNVKYSPWAADENCTKFSN